MNIEVQRSMIKLCNNSPLTGQAANLISKAMEGMETGDKNTILAWFKLAEREQENKISQAKRKHF